jgi:hypothetical protein
VDENLERGVEEDDPKKATIHDVLAMDGRGRDVRVRFEGS